MRLQAIFLTLLLLTGMFAFAPSATAQATEPDPEIPVMTSGVRSTFFPVLPAEESVVWKKVWVPADASKIDVLVAGVPNPSVSGTLPLVGPYSVGSDYDMSVNVGSPAFGDDADCYSGAFGWKESCTVSASAVWVYVGILNFAGAGPVYVTATHDGEPPVVLYFQNRGSPSGNADRFQVDEDEIFLNPRLPMTPALPAGQAAIGVSGSDPAGDTNYFYDPAFWGTTSKVATGSTLDVFFYGSPGPFAWASWFEFGPAWQVALYVDGNLHDRQIVFEPQSGHDAGAMLPGYPDEFRASFNDIPAGDHDLWVNVDVYSTYTKPTTIGPLTFNPGLLDMGIVHYSASNYASRVVLGPIESGDTSDEGGGEVEVPAAPPLPPSPSGVPPQFPSINIHETTDNDGVDDKFDNCPNTYNPTQADLDHDGIGDACDTDADGDGVPDTLDNCLRLKNDQADIDGDNVGDACDPDMDGDGFLNTKDVCPMVADDQADLDGDGIGDACDDDIDGDGVLNVNDLCVRLATIEHSDLDGDGIGDACDDDIDGDGILNRADLCPRHPDDGADMDGDGIGDACDADKDGDGRPDPIGGAPVEGLLGVDDAQVPGLGLVSVLALLGAVLVFRRK